MSDEERSLIATGSQTVGPFFHFGLAENDELGRLAGPNAQGERLHLRVRLLDGDGVAVPDALIELLQADADGRYAQTGERTGDAVASTFRGFGRLATDEDGTCVFETIRPGRVPDGLGGWLASHINVCVLARGLLRQLYTRIYFADDAALADDGVLALVQPDRRDTLLAHPVAGALPTWAFEIRLQGERETVFFDL